MIALGICANIFGKRHQPQPAAQTGPTAPETPAKEKPPPPMEPVKEKARAAESREGSAGLLLAGAKFFLDRAETAPAITRLRKCVADYPETKAAGEARELLKSLGRDD